MLRGRGDRRWLSRFRRRAFGRWRRNIGGRCIRHYLLGWLSLLLNRCAAVAIRQTDLSLKAGLDTNWRGALIDNHLRLLVGGQQWRHLGR